MLTAPSEPETDIESVLGTVFPPLCRDDQDGGTGPRFITSPLNSSWAGLLINWYCKQGSLSYPGEREARSSGVKPDGHAEWRKQSWGLPLCQALPSVSSCSICAASLVPNLPTGKLRPRVTQPGNSNSGGLT